MTYDNTNSGALFRDDKRTNDRAPEYTGKLDVNGKEYRIAAWIREGKKGKFFSLKIEEPRNQGDAQRAPQPEPDPFGDAPF